MSNTVQGSRVCYILMLCTNTFKVFLNVCSTRSMWMNKKENCHWLLNGGIQPWGSISTFGMKTVIMTVILLTSWLKPVSSFFYQLSDFSDWPDSSCDTRSVLCSQTVLGKDIYSNNWQCPGTTMYNVIAADLIARAILHYPWKSISLCRR